MAVFVSNLIDDSGKNEYDTNYMKLWRKKTQFCKGTTIPMIMLLNSQVRDWSKYLYLNCANTERVSYKIYFL